MCFALAQQAAQEPPQPAAKTSSKETAGQPANPGARDATKAAAKDSASTAAKETTKPGAKDSAKPAAKDKTKAEEREPIERRPYRISFHLACEPTARIDAARLRVALEAMASSGQAFYRTAVGGHDRSRFRAAGQC